MLLALFAPGIALAAPAANPPAPAPADPVKPAAASEPGAAASKPSDVEGVTVSGARPAIGTPPDKKAALAAEAAKDEAWRNYRKSTPPLTNNPNDDSRDFPGLQVTAPQ
jgi:hypothetical protein